MLIPHLLAQPDGSYTVLYVHEAADKSVKGSVHFTFSDIEYLRRSEINAHVDVSIHTIIPGTPNEEEHGEISNYSGRLNLASTSGRETFARAMGRISKTKMEFDSFLSSAIVQVEKAIRSKPRMIRLCDAPPKEEKQWLLEPYILDQAPNILFGEGGGGKTFVALRWMLSIATGIPFLGIKPTKTATCMFLDYEDSAAEANDRIMKLCGSKVMTPDGQTPDLELLQKNILYFPAEGVPIHDLVPQLKEKIAEHNVQFLLIDSAVMACGGEPEKAESAGRFFNSIAKLGVTTLTIAHETKSENHDHVFGSIFWRNCARNMWNAQAERDPVDNRKIAFGLFHRKCNHDALRAPTPLRIFHGQGFVDIERGATDEWGGKSLTVSDRIVAMLRSGPKQFGQLAMEMSDVKKETITQTLTRLNTRGILAKTGVKGDYWQIAVVSQNIDPTLPQKIGA